MTIILAVFFILCCANVSFSKEGTCFKDYMGTEQTKCIKGIFVLLVFLRHFLQYYTGAQSLDSFARSFDSEMGQLIVTLFLFYSGYGIMEGIKKKGTDYVKGIPGKTLKLLLHFDIVVILFLIVAIVYRSQLSVQKIGLSLICWDSLGNSNWYVFAVLAVYLMTFLSFFFFKGKHYYISAGILTALCVLFMIGLSFFKDEYWYNTVLCYPLGVFYSLLKDKIEKMLSKSNVLFYMIAAALVACFALFYIKRFHNVWVYSAWAITFTLLVVQLSMKISFRNSFLEFLGSHVFSIYILQRLPMIVLSNQGIVENHPYLSFAICFFGTIAIALLYDKGIAKLDNALFSKRQKTS